MSDHYNPPHPVASTDAGFKSPEANPITTIPESLNEVLDPLESLEPEPKSPLKNNGLALEKTANPNETFEVKVNGKVKHLTRDQMIVAAQKAEAANERFQQVSQKEQRLNEIMDALANNPEAVLEQLGMNVDEMAEKRLASKLKRSQLTPEQIRQSELEEKLANYEKSEKQQRDERLKVENEKTDQQTFAAVERDLIGAAERHNLNSDPHTLELMCDVALEAIELGYNITPDQIAQEVIRKQEDHIKSRDERILGKLSGEQLLSYLGKANVDKVLKATLAAKGNSKPRGQVSNDVPISKPDKGYRTEQEINEQLKKYGVK